MSHKNVKKLEEDYMGLSYSLDNGERETREEEDETVHYSEDADSSFNELEGRVEKLKNDVKNLKKIKKQQEKLGKLEEKKLEILKEIEREQYRDKKSRSRHDKRKR